MTFVQYCLTAKEAMDPKLAIAMTAWIREEKPDVLIKEYNQNPKLFADLDKAEGHSNLFRVLVVTKAEMKDFMATRKMVNEHHGLESWSLSLAGLQTFSDRATDHPSSNSSYLLVLKRNVPLAERLAYIPSLLPIPGIDDSDNAWIEEEQEVVCVAKDIEWKWVKKILYPGDSPKSKSFPISTVKNQLKY